MGKGLLETRASYKGDLCPQSCLESESGDHSPTPPLPLAHSFTQPRLPAPCHGPRALPGRRTQLWQDRVQERAGHRGYITDLLGVRDAPKEAAAVWLWRSAGRRLRARRCRLTCPRVRAHVGAGAVPAGSGVGRALRAPPSCLRVSRSVSPWVSASCLLLPTTSAAVTRDKAAPGRGRARGPRQSQRRWARPQLRLTEPTSNQTPGNRKPLSGLLSSPPL